MKTYPPVTNVENCNCHDYAWLKESTVVVDEPLRVFIKSTYMCVYCGLVMEVIDLTTKIIATTGEEEK